MEIDSSEMQADELKEIRQKIGWNKLYLSKVLSVAPSTITRYESGSHTIPGPFAALMRIIRSMKKENTND